MPYQDHKSQLFKKLRDRCCQNPGLIALPECDDLRVFAAAADLVREGSVAKVYTFTSTKVLNRNCKELAIDLSSLRDRLVADEDIANADIDTKCEAAGRLLQTGKVNAVLAGAVANTATVIRAAIHTVGVAPGGKTISGAFLMNREAPGLSPHTYLYADAGVVIDPDAQQLQDIARCSVQTWQTLIPDETPVVAFLSFSTAGSAQHQAAEKMAAAAQTFAQRFPSIECAGEIQFDAAYDRDVGIRKLPNSNVPGRANIFIFPNLDAGNIAYKISQRLGSFTAYGPILQGAGKPFSDLSRGATTGDILASCYINLIRGYTSD